jgi:hypothetical protein
MTMGENSIGWMRLPRTGKSFMGCSRSTLYRLMKTGRIRYSVLAQPGRKTGITFFSATDLDRQITASAKGSMTNDNDITNLGGLSHGA